MPDVLILDDDALLCELMADTLRDEGLDVLTAGDTDSAAILLHEQGARVLVADKGLDGRTVREDGHVFAAAAAAFDQMLSVVYITGEQGGLTGRTFTARESGLPKPFIPNELVAAVKDLLARRPVAGV
jgi:DNA-binding response OmpR family regulator